VETELKLGPAGKFAHAWIDSKLTPSGDRRLVAIGRVSRFGTAARASPMDLKREGRVRATDLPAPVCLNTHRSILRVTRPVLLCQGERLKSEDLASAQPERE